MQVDFASNRKIFVFILCEYINNYGWFWIPVRPLIKLNKNEYMVIAKDELGGESHGGLEMKAITKATEFCGEKGLKIIDTDKTGDAGWTATSVTIKFRCLTDE